MDSDDPSLAEVLERLEDVRKGSTLVSWLKWSQCCTVMFCVVRVETWELLNVLLFFVDVFLLASSATEASHLWPLSALQPATASRCGNARSACTYWPDYTRAEGALCCVWIRCILVESLFLLSTHNVLSHWSMGHQMRWHRRKRRRKKWERYICVLMAVLRIFIVYWSNCFSLCFLTLLMHW